ncbi:MAG: superinfection immunity protein [Acidobacteriaceae bacterium]|nr:superinfection immunity protein [Acidobacteriaceae bacterium]
MHVLFALCLLPFGAIHFLPTIVALLRDSQHKVGIFLLNLFLGWTVIGWVVALVLAFRCAPRYQSFAYAGYAPQGWRRY